MDKKLPPEQRIGLALRRQREALGWSQEALSFECGLHRTYIGAVERGEKNLTVRNIVRIAQAMNTTAALLMTDAGLLPHQRPGVAGHFFELRCQVLVRRGQHLLGSAALDQPT